MGDQEEMDGVGDDEARMATEQDDPEEEETPSQQAAGKNSKQCKWPCIRCKKNVTSSGVKCEICCLWVHVKCYNIPKELYNFLKAPNKYPGVCWRCDSCNASAAMLDNKITKLQSQVKEVAEKVVRAEGAVQDVTRRVNTVEERQDKVEDLLDKERERVRRERIDETRERDLRKKNVIIHRMPEAGDDVASVGERKEWDMQSVENLLKAVKLPLTKSAIRFCRRIGERGAEPRPLVVGFMRESHKEDLLEVARELINTAFSEVGVVPDLTQEQRRDEAELNLTAEKRNAERSEDDMAKNLIWKVVGRRGEKRLVKVTAREGDGDRAGVDRGESGRGHPLPPRGRGRPWGPSRGATGAGPARRGGPSVRGGPAERANLLDLVRNGSNNRPRINSKRAREDRGEEGEGMAEEEEGRTQPVAPTDRAR